VVVVGFFVVVVTYFVVVVVFGFFVVVVGYVFVVVVGYVFVVVVFVVGLTVVECIGGRSEPEEAEAELDELAEAESFDTEASEELEVDALREPDAPADPDAAAGFLLFLTSAAVSEVAAAWASDDLMTAAIKKRTQTALSSFMVSGMEMRKDDDGDVIGSIQYKLRLGYFVHDLRVVDVKCYPVKGCFPHLYKKTATSALETALACTFFRCSPFQPL
jgi:hypothetical protein